MKRITSFARSTLSLVLALSLAPSPAAAATPPKDNQPSPTESSHTLRLGSDGFDFRSDESAQEAVRRLTTQSALPERFDLRNVDTDGDGVGDTSYVTPVRSQYPFGTCWAFSVVAAAESSLLSSGLAVEDGYDANTLDISEKHVAYFASTPIDDPNSSQYAGCRRVRN